MFDPFLIIPVYQVVPNFSTERSLIIIRVVVELRNTTRYNPICVGYKNT